MELYTDESKKRPQREQGRACAEVWTAARTCKVSTTRPLSSLCSTHPRYHTSPRPSSSTLHRYSSNAKNSSPTLRATSCTFRGLTNGVAGSSCWCFRFGVLLLWEYLRDRGDRDADGGASPTLDELTDRGEVEDRPDGR